MHKDILHEVTPLTEGDCFTLFYRQKRQFDFPLHYHEEFELNFIMNAKGAKRIVGDHEEVIDDMELVLAGPGLRHGWFNHECNSPEITEITIQFHRDLLDENLLRRNQLSFIKAMLEKSVKGIQFSKSTIQQNLPRIIDLRHKQGFDSVLELFSILQNLSVSRNMRILSSDAIGNNENTSYNSRRVQKVLQYMNKNFDRSISLSEMAHMVNMTEESFSRFFKKSTGNTFINSLNQIRIGNASRMLIDTTRPINEIAYHCGFNNISNFNRIFKNRKYCTPKEYREHFSSKRIFI